MASHIKISIFVLMILNMGHPVFPKTGQLKPGGKTPMLESSPLFKNDRPSGGIKLEVFDKVSKSSDFTYVNALETEKPEVLTHQKVYLKIKITNVTAKSTGPLTIKYKIFGMEKKKDFLRSIKVGKKFLVGSGDLFLKESLKFGESGQLETDSSLFEVQKVNKTMEVMHRGTVTEQIISGTRYGGYHVEVYDDKNTLVAELEE